MRGNEKIFIQVSDDLSNLETFKREYTPLLQVKEAYPKMIIARTRFTMFNGYAPIDLGIAKCHFEIGAGKDNFEWM